jgi:hypothetical protein
MKNFVVEFAPNMRLMEGYETISGKTAKEAIEKRFGKPVKRVSWANAADCDFIITTGTYDPEENIIHRQGNRMCFNIL